MNTTAKIILGVSVLGLTAVSLYLFFKNKKDGSANGVPNPPNGTSSLTSSSGSQISSPQGNAQPIVTSNIPTNKPTIPLPNDLSIEQMQAVKDFCSLPDGKQRNMLMLNLDLNTKWGLVNTFYYINFQGKVGMSLSDYNNGIKKYLGC